MMRGRKPLPTHLKLVTGNAGRRPLNEDEPQPDNAIPHVPEHLSPVAKTEWRRVARVLFDLGILTNIDRASLAGYCQAYSDWIEMEQKLAKFGKVIMSPKRTVTKKHRDGSETTESSGGYPIQSPYLAIRNKALEQMNKFAVEFGMTPSSRSRVNAPAGGHGKKTKASKYIG